LYFYYFRSCHFRGISYFLVCNPKRDDEVFSKGINFEEYLIPYDWNIDWIEEEIDLMLSLMNNDQIPKPNYYVKIVLILSNYPGWFQIL